MDVARLSEEQWNEIIAGEVSSSVHTQDQMNIIRETLRVAVLYTVAYTKASAADITGEKLKVAAYCRVSTDTEEQKTSFDRQVETYTAMIGLNPEWQFAGIYADEGVSGTSAQKRPEFMRMMEDCDAGKINLILTKSISRFARNVRSL